MIESNYSLNLCRYKTCIYTSLKFIYMVHVQCGMHIVHFGQNDILYVLQPQAQKSQHFNNQELRVLIYDNI